MDELPAKSREWIQDPSTGAWIPAPGTALGAYVQGPVADDAAAGTEKPVPVGGIYRVTGPAYTDGDRTQDLSDSRGNKRVAIVGVGTNSGAATRSPADAAAGAGSLVTDAAMSYFNGATWDRARGDLTRGLDVNQTDRAAREVGRVRLWDGTDEATVVPLRTQPATTEKTIPVFNIPNRLAAYGCATAEIAPAITVGVKELLAIWAAVGGAKDKLIVEIWLTALVTTASTAGRTTARVSTITTAPTGGTELTKTDISGAGASDMTNTMQVKTGGGTIGTTFKRRELWHATQAVDSRVSEPLFQASNLSNGIILRAGSGLGISIDCERAVAHTALVDQWVVEALWIEI